jgi:hypothetical protein
MTWRFWPLHQEGISPFQSWTGSPPSKDGDRIDARRSPGRYLRGQAKGEEQDKGDPQHRGRVGWRHAEEEVFEGVEGCAIDSTSYWNREMVKRWGGAGNLATALQTIPGFWL